MRILLPLLLGCASLCHADLVGDVRSALKQRQPAEAERLVQAARDVRGDTSEAILALSWLGRGAVDDKRWDDAARYSNESLALVTQKLGGVKLDSDPNLAGALGNTIDVQAAWLASQNGLSESIAYLNGEVTKWRDTSIQTRIQKTIHSLTLEGKPALPLEAPESIGGQPPSLTSLRGKAVLLFFWAHWCSDCKAQGPILERIQNEFASQGLVLVGPTRRYGYIGAADTPADPVSEFAYMQRIRTERFAALKMAVPVSEENFKNYGSSSSPTLVLIDAAGTVRMYHPGGISYEELAPIVRRVLPRQN